MVKQLLSRVDYLEKRQYPSQRRVYLATDAEVEQVLAKLHEMYYERMFQETRLQCLAVQEEVVQRCLSGAGKSATHWVGVCTKELNTVLEMQVLSYGDYLKAREYEADGILPMEEMRAQLAGLVADYRLLAPLFLEADSAGTLIDIQGQYKEQDATYNTLFDAMTLEGMRKSDIDDEWGSFCQKNAAALKKQISGDLLALCEQGDLAGVKRCIEAYPKKFQRTYVNRQVVTLRDEIASVNTSALHLACLYGHLEIATYLLERGASPLYQDSEGYLPIHWAVWEPMHRDGAAIVQLLVERAPTVLNQVGIYGRTALHTAAFRGHVPGVACLVALGANMQAQEEHTGMMPLHSAVSAQQIAVIEWLLAHGASPWVENALKETPLQMAALHCQEDVVNCFMMQGVILSARQTASLKSMIAMRRASPEALLMVQRLMTRYLNALAAEVSPVSAANLGQGLSRALNLAAQEGGVAASDQPLMPAANAPGTK